MSKFANIDEILDFAIGQEEEAAKFYTELAEKMARPEMKQIFLEFAAEEVKHKESLLAVKAGKKLVPSASAVASLRIADYVVSVPPGPELDYQGALILAMKKEKAAFSLYTHLSETTDDPGVKSTFLALAQEEAKHKLRFEIEYDDYILTEN